MSLSDLASLGSFISGIAVVFSFVFLALQLRQANLSQKATVHQARTTRTVDQLLHLLEFDLSKGFAGDADMTERSVTQFRLICITIFLSFEDSFYQHKIGLMDDGAFASYASRVRGYLAAPGARAMWRLVRSDFEPGFAAFCDEVANQARRVSPDDVNLNAWLKLVAQEKAPTA